MIRRMDHRQMGRSRQNGWNSWLHFSFADYINPNRMHFSALRILNDDSVQPGCGFDMHPHNDMEIIAYVVQGELTHGDSLKNRRILHRGDVQYTSAGTGIVHSEFNYGTELLRLLQIGILPDRPHRTPHYGNYRFDAVKRKNQWFAIASPVGGPAPIHIHQDVLICISELSQGRSLNYPLACSRQAYLVLIEGNACVCGMELEERDAIEVIGEDIAITAYTNAHLMLFDLPLEKPLFDSSMHKIGRKNNE